MKYSCFCRSIAVCRNVSFPFGAPPSLLRRVPLVHSPVGPKNGRIAVSIAACHAAPGREARVQEGGHRVSGAAVRSQGPLAPR